VPDRTAFIARLIGLYCLIAALVMAFERDAWLAAITALTSAAPLMLLLGLMVVAAGLALVLAHNVWSGGVLPVAVTVIGWLTLLKGLMFWVLPPGAAADFYLTRLHYAGLFYVYCALAFAIGLYLTVAGFTRKARAP
jgi:vacuolar-type H+-ATPase subunit I/STV1